MNAIVKQTPLEAFRQQVLPPEKATDLWKSLPSHIKPAVFERNLMNALMANPELVKFHPSLVYREVSKAAGLGLLLDPQLGEAYIVVAYNYKSGNKEPQLRIGYKGMCKLARQAGDVSNIYAHEVCAKDPINCHLGTDKKLVHEPDLFGDRGPVVGYYAVIKFNDGVFDFEPMSLKQVRDIRDRSDAWKAFKADKIKSTPWSTDEDEMAKKTVLRRLLKRQPQSPELAAAIGIEDTAEFPTMRNDLRTTDDGPPPPPPLQIAKQETPLAPVMAQADRDIELVEAGRHEPGTVTWDDFPPEDDPPSPSAAPRSHETADPALSAPTASAASGGAGDPIDQVGRGPSAQAKTKEKLEATLLAEIEDAVSMNGCLLFARDMEARMATLPLEAKARIRAAHMAKQQTFKPGKA